MTPEKIGRVGYLKIDLRAYRRIAGMSLDMVDDRKLANWSCLAVMLAGLALVIGLGLVGTFGRMH